MSALAIRETCAMQLTKELHGAGAPHAAGQACLMKLDAEALMLARQNDLMRQQLKRTEMLIQQINAIEDQRRMI